MSTISSESLENVQKAYKNMSVEVANIASAFSALIE
jgi:hypothetical protein